MEPTTQPDPASPSTPPPAPVTPPGGPSSSVGVLAPPKSSKKPIAIGALLVALVLAAAGYFFVVPTLQVADQKKLESKHNAVNDKLVRVYDNFKTGAFSRTDTKTAEDKADLKAGREAVEDAKAALDANETALTKFTSLPFLSWNSKYKTATDTDAKEGDYVKKARAFLADYSELLDYGDKEVVLEQKAEDAMSGIEGLKNATSVAAITQALDTATTMIQSLIDGEKQLTPPSYLKADQAESIAAATKLVATLKSMNAAIKALDIAKIQSTSADLDKQSKDLEKLSQKYVNLLQKDSPIAKGQLTLRALHNEIIKAYASL